VALMVLLWVMIAGGVGSGARYLVGHWAAARLDPSFPYGTLIVNLLGCFAVGLVAQLASAAAWSPELRAAVTTGFLGGFTTYSSFNQETLSLFAAGTTAPALLNVAVTLLGGLAAGWLGVVAARQLVA
jgi:CrcB protein